VFLVRNSYPRSNEPCVVGRCAHGYVSPAGADAPARAVEDHAFKRDTGAGVGAKHQARVVAAASQSLVRRKAVVAAMKASDANVW
jgi:hypothetical protein